MVISAKTSRLLPATSPSPLNHGGRNQAYKPFLACLLLSSATLATAEAQPDRLSLGVYVYQHLCGPSLNVSANPVAFGNGAREDEQERTKGKTEAGWPLPSFPTGPCDTEAASKDSLDGQYIV